MDYLTIPEFNTRPQKNLILENLREEQQLRLKVNSSMATYSKLNTDLEQKYKNLSSDVTKSWTDFDPEDTVECSNTLISNLNLELEGSAFADDMSDVSSDVQSF